MGQTVKELCAAIGGRLAWGDPGEVVSTGQVRFLSGHELSRSGLREQLLSQAISCIVVRDMPRDQHWQCFAIILVEGLSQAYHRFAAWHRQQLRLPVVQVIGSIGKTTTRDMIGATLQHLNPLMDDRHDLDGVAWSILRVRTDHNAAIAVAEADQPNQMQQISRLLRPDVLVVTAIERTPGPLERTLQCLAEALEFINPRGLLLINGDDLNMTRLPLQQFSGQVARYGTGLRQDITISGVQAERFRTSFQVRLGTLHWQCRINSFGEHNLHDAMAAIYVGHHLGLSPAAIAAGLEGWQPREGRMRLHYCNDGMIYINDNYRATPESTPQLLRALAEVDRQYKLVLVLGDMFSPTSEQESAIAAAHYAVGLEAAKLQPTRLVAVGKWAVEYIRAARAAGLPEVRLRHFQQPAEAGDYLLSVVEPASLVVFKGDERWAKFGQLMQLMDQRP